MADIPLPPSKQGQKDGNPDANCEKYEAIMGYFCKYCVTKTGECMIKFNLCDGYAELK
ncbi:MAG: hypothetical protein ACTSQF_15670 [Candidatus Heimdallarchaeaceae archaeon]